MGKIAIELSPAQLQKTKKLIDSGVYDSVQQLGEIAFANQLALEDGADPEDLAQEVRERRHGETKGRPRPRIPPLPPPKPRKPSAPAKQFSGRLGDMVRGVPKTPTFVAVTSDLTVSNESSATPGAMPTTAAPTGQRILGLVNKPFGLKLVVRSLMVNAATEWPPLEGIAFLAARQAATIGTELAAEDRAAKRSRNLLHTGFPSLENQESIDRFAIQYVGRVAKSGNLTPGAVEQFALAALADGRLILSMAGIEFARLANPVLDGGTRPWERVLSSEEQEFLVKHIMHFVPAEAQDARSVVEAVHAGNDRPESLLAALKGTLPSAWTDVQARSYLSGLVTRLSELDVLNRTWTGRTVRYGLTTHAPAVLHGISAKEVA